MATIEGFPSEEDELISKRRVMMDILAGQEEASLGAQLDGVITAEDISAARLAFDEEYLVDDFNNDMEVGEL